MDMNTMSAVDAAARIARGEITCEAYAAANIERIQRREETVGAWAYFDPDRVMEKARELDRVPAMGPLHGIPVGIKDVLDTADLPTGYGSPIYEGYRPVWDASCVAIIRASGGIIMGKTATAELATYSPARTTNPRNPAHTPGGSSSGSAAAVADFMAPLAIGTQTAGSVIRPASYCGVVGYKPSFGWINRVGMKVVSETLDTLGLFGRAMEDVALLGTVLAGRPLALDRGFFGRPPRVGFCKTFEWPSAAPESISAFESSRDKLKSAGAQTHEIILPDAFGKLAVMQKDIMFYEAARSLAFEYNTHKGLLSANLRDLIEAGKSISVKTYDLALKHAAKCRRLLGRIFRDIDIIIAPSVPGEAPEGLASTGDPVFNRIWTLLYVPCVNIPYFSGPKGLPVGIQAVGRYGDDRRVLAGAAWVMKTLAG
ncbi:MAG: amidase [Syntrophobacter sp.]